MKSRVILLALGLALGVMLASCSASSKTCPAYSNADDQVTVDNRS